MPFQKRWFAVTGFCLSILGCSGSTTSTTAGGEGGAASGGAASGGAAGDSSATVGGAGGFVAPEGGSVGTGSGGTGTGGAGGAVMSGGSGGTPIKPSGIPIVVALGDGGWTMASCDFGRTWKVNTAFSAERGDHTEWTTFGGLAFGNGTIVGATGWGAPGHILVSNDGVSMTDVPDSAFLRANKPEGLNSSIGGVAFDGTQFVAFSEWVWRSTDGRNWSGSNNTWPRGVQQLRQLRGFAEQKLLVASVETQNGGEHPLGNWVVVSENGGATWREGTGYRASCSNPIQHVGDIEMLGETLIVGTNDVCVSTDRGKTWSFVASPAGGELGDLFRDNEAFYAVAGDRLMRSVDGKAWQAFGQKLPERVDRGTFVEGHFVLMGARANKVFHSATGMAWQSVSPPGVGTTQWVRDLGVAHGTANAMCPQP
jgi:hypothetical protein